MHRIAVSLEQGERPSPDLAKAAKKKVSEWRDQNELYLPKFPDERVAELRGTLPYPPEGSVKPKTS